MTHTPAPWVIHKTFSSISGVTTEKGETIRVKGFALSMNNSGNDIEAESNTYLLAAAPELLEALEDLCGAAKSSGYPHEALKRAEAAILKARGQA